MSEKEPTLQLNRQTGKYEGYLLVQVEPELLRRALLRVVEEDETLDLSNPAAWASAFERVGKATKWKDNPHTVIKPVQNIAYLALEPKLAPLTSPKKAESTAFQKVEARLRKEAQKVPPYQWLDTLVTPFTHPEYSSSHPEKKHEYYDQKRREKNPRCAVQRMARRTFPCSC